MLLFTALGLTVLLLWGSVLLPSRSSSLEVTFLDVGQGAAALVEAPCGTTILIDGEGNLLTGAIQVERARWCCFHICGDRGFVGLTSPWLVTPMKTILVDCFPWWRRSL